MILSEQKYIDWFVDHWVNHLPDISDYPDIAPEKLHFWKKRSKKDKRKSPHRTLKGCAAKWLNESIDFAISQNKWAVR